MLVDFWLTHHFGSLLLHCLLEIHASFQLMYLSEISSAISVFTSLSLSLSPCLSKIQAHPSSSSCWAEPFHSQLPHWSLARLEVDCPVLSAVTRVGGRSQPSDVLWNMGNVFKKHSRASLIGKRALDVVGYILACLLGTPHRPAKTVYGHGLKLRQTLNSEMPKGLGSECIFFN